MSRDLSTITLENIEANVVYPFFAVELLFDSPNEIRLWTGVGDLSYGGHTWTGSGNLLDISSVEEGADLAVRGATITLSGMTSEVVSLALQEPYQGRVCNIYFGTFSTGAILQESGSFILLQDGSKINIEDGSTGFNQTFSGYMDQMNIQENPDTATIELTVENKLIDLERPRIARYTSAYQKSVYPGDLGMDFIEDLQDKEIIWGRSPDKAKTA